MGRKSHRYQKSYCAPCVPCNTQVGNGLLNIAGIAAKANGRLDPIGKESLELFDALFPVTPVAGGVQPATNSELYALFASPAFNVTYYNCATCAPEYQCASNTICAEFTKYTNYVISTGMDVLRLTSFCFPETQAYLNYSSSFPTTIPATLFSNPTYQLYEFNVTLNVLLNALTLNCTGATPLFACTPVTPKVMPPAVSIPAGAPIQIKPHDAKNAKGGCSGFASSVQADCACAGDEAPKEEKKEPEKKKGRIANIFSKLRKKVSNKSSDA
jgi:hypothetical protein